ncbi:hypothetical protein ACFQ07_05450, partial [Actinomadura adrarensis]
DVRAASYTGTQSIASPFGPARVTVDGSAAVLPNPLDVLGDHSGADRTHFALDLEFTTIGGAYPYRDIIRYEIPCTVTGTVQVGTEKVSIDAYGERDHSWGERDWWRPSWLWSSGRLDDGTAFHGMQANIPFPMEWPSFLVPENEPVRHMPGFAAGTHFDDDGLPTASRLELKSAPMT